jgi:hypothetical protein
MNGNSLYLQFDGAKSYVEIPDSADLSVATTGVLSVSLWIRPAALIFPNTEGGDERYVHFAGKGTAGQQEWVFRIYSQDNAVGRDNRISFYLFNAAGHIGIGSHFQEPLSAGLWIHVVGVADGTRTNIYRDGIFKDSDVYAGQITPAHGSAPMRVGTRDLKSFFMGEMRELRVWNRALAAAEVQALHDSGIVPPDGLVAEFLLTQDTAVDTAGAHNGVITGATWVAQDS